MSDGRPSARCIFTGRSLQGSGLWPFPGSCSMPGSLLLRLAGAGALAGLLVAFPLCCGWFLFYALG